MKNKIKIFIIIISVLILSIILIFNRKSDFSDAITHGGKAYVYLETNMDIFNYEFNNSNNDYYEEDIIHKVPYDRWTWSILISDNELKYLYNMDNVKREETMVFE